MQVLETIQEYTPIKHGLNYLSSWIGKNATYTPAAEGQPREEDARENEDKEESSSPDTWRSDGDSNLDLETTQFQTPPETIFLGGREQLLPLNQDCEKCQDTSNSNNGKDCVCDHKLSIINGRIFSDTSEFSQTNPASASTPAHTSEDKSGAKAPEILVNNVTLDEKNSEVTRDDTNGFSLTYEHKKMISEEDARRFQSQTRGICTSDISIDDPLSSATNLSEADYSVASSSRSTYRENGVIPSATLRGVPKDLDGGRRFPKLLTTFHKRQLKGRRHKKNSGVDGRIIFRRFRLPDSSSEIEPLRRDSRSKSESDLNIAVASSRLSETSGDSDHSAQSLNVLQENTEDEYVDIDFCPKGSLSGSSYRDTSLSSESLELSSDWTQYTLSISTNSVGEECRESDLQDTESCRSQDLSINLPTHRTKRKRWKKRFLHGQAVNEFVDKECFCCHCVIL